MGEGIVNRRRRQHGRASAATRARRVGSSSARAPIAPRRTSSSTRRSSRSPSKGKAERAADLARPVATRRGSAWTSSRRVDAARSAATTSSHCCRRTFDAHDCATLAAARHDHRRARRRQDTVDRGVPDVRRRRSTRSSAGGRAAACPTARASRSGRSARSSRRRPASSSPTRPRKPSRSCRSRSRRSASDDAERDWLGCEPRPRRRRRATPRWRAGGVVHRVAALLEGDRRASGRWSSSSRICTGRTSAGRFRRASRRLVDRRAAARALHRAARAVRTASGWGGGKRNSNTISLVPARGRRHRTLFAAAVAAARSSPPRRRQRSSNAPAAIRSTRRSSSGCSPTRSDTAAGELIDERHPLPETVQALIAARLDTLRRTARRSSRRRRRRQGLLDRRSRGNRGPSTTEPSGRASTSWCARSSSGPHAAVVGQGQDEYSFWHALSGTSRISRSRGRARTRSTVPPVTGSSDGGRTRLRNRPRSRLPLSQQALELRRAAGIEPMRRWLKDRSALLCSWPGNGREVPEYPQKA